MRVAVFTFPIQNLTQNIRCDSVSPNRARNCATLKAPGPRFAPRPRNYCANRDAEVTQTKQFRAANRIPGGFGVVLDCNCSTKLTWESSPCKRAQNSWLARSLLSRPCSLWLTWDSPKAKRTITRLPSYPLCGDPRCTSACGCRGMYGPVPLTI